MHSPAFVIAMGVVGAFHIGFELLSPSAAHGSFDENGKERTMSETLGRLLAAGQRADVFEWGSRVVKIYGSTGLKQVVFREAAINAAVEALGLPVPAVWGAPDRRPLGYRFRPSEWSFIRGADAERPCRDIPASSGPRAPAYAHSRPRSGSVQQPERLVGNEDHPNNAC